MPESGGIDERRLVVALFGVAVAVVVGFVAYRFIAALTVSIFLYYSTRRFYKGLERLRLPDRVRAAVTLSVLAVPLLLLLAYTLVLLILQFRTFVEEYPVVETAAANVEWLDSAEEVPELTLSGLIEAYRSGTMDPMIDFVLGHAGVLTGVVTSLLVNLLIITVVTYYLLIDGPTFREWLLRFDDEAIVREYLEAADEELEAVLFGNLLNVILISFIAILVFMGYNAVVPEPVEVPYPALAGTLTGLASLIPVVGMKIVYLPLAVAAAFPVVVSGDLSGLAYIAGFLVVAVVLVDTIPDLVLRPYLSGERTHVGLLMLAYILGPIVFGFYGLFLAPIVLVLGVTFADTALPRLLGVEREVPGPETGAETPDVDETPADAGQGTAG